MGKGEVTRQRIIDSAAELIHANGMNVVTVGDVLKASGTGKSQFYSHFESRDDLIRNVLEHNEARICEALSAPLESWTDVRNWIFIHMEFQSRYEFQRGCPFGTAAYALRPGQAAERKPLQEILDHLRNRLKEFLDNELAEGRLSKDASPERLASFTVAAIQGSLILGLIEEQAKSVSDSLEECYAHLESYRL